MPASAAPVAAPAARPLAARRAPVAAAPAAAQPSSQADWPPQDPASHEWPADAAADGSELPPGFDAGYDAAPIPAPAYVPPAGMQVSAPYTPPSARKPLNKKLILGGSIAAGLLVVGALLYVIVFSSTRWKLSGTWIPKSGPENFLRGPVSMELTFSYTGKFTVAMTGTGRSKESLSFSGSWELLDDKRMKMTLDPKSLPKEAQDMAQDSKPDIVDFELVNSDTLRFKSREFGPKVELVRK